MENLIQNAKDNLPSKNVFNTDKDDYENTDIIFGQKMGLMDTINKRYPDLWKLYKTLKSLDWDENEFDYSSCIQDFKTCDPVTYDMMIKTLAWQWEADSVASTILTKVLGNVVSSGEVWAGWVEIARNEIVHANTYSEIERGSFEENNTIIKDVVKVQESLSRLSLVTHIFAKALETSNKYALGQVENNQESYNDIFLFIATMLCMERIQFMASFAVTFAICDMGLFQPIGKAVQKIAQDEYEIHVPYQMGVIRHLMATPRGLQAYNDTKPMIINVIDAVVETERNWVDYAFSEGRELTGVTKEMMLNWVYFNASIVAKFFAVENNVDFPIVNTNPLPYMEEWIAISNTQSSPQEEQINNYKVNVVADDNTGEVLDFEL